MKNDFACWARFTAATKPGTAGRCERLRLLFDERQLADVNRGRVRLRDPGTGEQLEGVAGKNYYYRIGTSNKTFGTDVSIGFGELEQIR